MIRTVVGAAGSESSRQAFRRPADEAERCRSELADPGGSIVERRLLLGSCDRAQSVAVTVS